MTAQRRLRQWKSQSPFCCEDYFLKRLALDDLDEASFSALLGESMASLQHRLPEVPSWLTHIERAFQSPGDFSKGPPVVGSLIARAHTVLNAKAEELSHAWPGVEIQWGSIIEQLVSAMTSRLDERISRAVVLDMRVATLQGTLTGRDPHERFRGFLECLRDPGEALLFLRQYPVLARMLIDSVDDWTEAATELLERLCTDWERIHATFWPNRDLGPLTRIETGLGDLHRRGREVCVLYFGSAGRLLYKPRSLRIDRHFALLLSWLHERGAPALRTPRILDRGVYGWSEFVSQAPCRNREEVCQFYMRQGSLLAVLYLLNANDFHHENLIAAGGHPVPIDLETLCGPDFGQAQESSYDSYSEFELKNSVVNTMLLPFLREGEDGHTIDRSGLGAREGQLSIELLPRWEHLGTDQVALSFQRREVTARQNLPQLDGAPLNAFEFVADIEAGFTSMYRLIEANRTELLSPEGPLSAMRNDEVRVVFRATQFYNKILQQSYHPDYLSDALDRDRLLDRLWFGIDRTAFPHIAHRLLPGERQDLWRGEVPYFTTRVDSQDLRTSDGRCLNQFFTRSGWDMIRDRLAHFGEENLHRQLWYIQASMSTLALNNETVFRSYRAPVGIRPVDRKLLLDQASAVAERIIELARWRHDCASWIGLTFGESRGWQLNPLQTDLYSGLPGIILFLSYAEELTGRDEYGATARGALATLRNQMKHRHARLESVGGFDGWGGLIYLWTHLSHLWGSEHLLAETGAMVSRVEELANLDDHMDVVQGTAGAIVPLLTLHKMTGAGRPLDVARKLGDRLVSRAQPCGGGVGWLGKLFPVRPLTGFSHGASGFAWALTELFAITGDEAYAQTALQAVAFERGHFSSSSGNWADLRRSSRAANSQGMTAWCHGACGIGMSRLRMQTHLGNEVLREDLEIALQTTCREGFGKNHSLCHGDLGSLDFILQASLCFPATVGETQLSERLSKSLAAIEEHGWRCGTPLDVETPGMMDGLAGIGYGLLRLAEPVRIPSVLILGEPCRMAPPVANQTAAADPGTWSPKKGHGHHGATKSR
ncbi:type 2 lanthipeptide synthetase LanM family protein [Actinomadura verrucosospora]